jgi:hypothetical protein
MTAGEIQAAMSSAYTDDEVVVSIRAIGRELHGQVTGVTISKQSSKGQVLLQTSFDETEGA